MRVLLLCLTLTVLCGLLASAQGQTTDCTTTASAVTPTTTTPLAGDVWVPVFFHVITHSNGSGNVSMQMLQDQIAYMDAQYASANPSSRIRFRLAGVSYTQNDDWHLNMMTSQNVDNATAAAAKAALAIAPAYALNVYVADLTRATVNGYAIFPDQYSSEGD